MAPARACKQCSSDDLASALPAEVFDVAERVRAIIHADLDAFYASVEQRDDPSLRGRPVVVGGSAEARGVVAAASYEARRFGIHSAMSMRSALRLCPQVTRVAPRFAVYGEVSGQVMAVFREYTELVEPISLDEAYLDVSAATSSWENAARIAAELKQKIKECVSLTLSVGVGSSKSIAKIASDLGKPDGLLVVPPGTERDFLAPLSVSKLWGVGPRAEERLRALGVRTIGELAEFDPRLLAQLFGRWGEQMSALAQGVDAREVTPSHEIKSVGRETTFDVDVGDPRELDRTLKELCAAVAERLERRGLRGRTVTVKLRRSDFSTHTRQVTLPAPVHEERQLLPVAARLLAAELTPDDRLRLVGVSVSGFAETAQLPLFVLE
jgi:DNA polymerase-4